MEDDTFVIHDNMVYFGERQIMNAKPNGEHHGGAGCQVLFENGWTLSVQWHGGNYCERNNQPFGGPVNDIHSRDCEIAAWDHEDKWFYGWNGGDYMDEVIGWVSVDMALELVDTFAAMPSGLAAVKAIYPSTLRQIES